jgi:uroporphyrin-III C-methyltransferase
MGSVTFVGAGPGAPDLITLRGWRALQSAEVVLYDALIDPAFVDELDAELIFVGKRCGAHLMSQEEINCLLVLHAKTGKRVVRLKGGDPGVLGRVGEEAAHVAEAGVPFQIVPGVSSAMAGPALAGIPLTLRGVSDGFTLVTAHRRQDELDFSIPPFEARRTLLLLMGVKTTPDWQRQLLSSGYPATLPLAFVESASRAAQRVVISSVEQAARDVIEQEVRAPALVVIGEVVAHRLEGSALEAPQAAEAGLRSLTA